MTALLFLIPAALCLGGVGLAAFLWALNSGQYDDLEGAALRVLDDADIEPQRRARTGSQQGESVRKASAL